MKFIAKTLTKCAPRLGLVSEIHRLPDFKLETPATFLYTRGGNIPHITREVLKFITTETQCVQLPITSTLDFQESLEDIDRTVADFVGLHDCLSYVTVQDPGNITPSGHHMQNNIPVWTRSGKMYITAESYMDIIESFKPDFYCLLSDRDTNKVSSKKRIAKAVDQTLSFAEKCLERHDKSKVLTKSTVIACVEGGYCFKSRERCIKGLLKEKDKFGGYLLSGLHNNGPEMEFLQFDEVKPVAEYIINSLPEDKMRIVEGCWNPVNIIKFVQMGVDIFDTSYLNLLVERSSAITFDFKLQEERNVNKHQYEINLRDPRHEEDFQSILPGCNCLTCRKYSRAYVHHLINVQELLGPVLLAIHNTHHYLQFFKAIRQCIKNGTLENLEQYILQQFEEHQNITNQIPKNENIEETAM